ncbi:MAG: hypothetical protein Q9173_003860, partial [Seirophora scorigena]
MGDIVSEDVDFDQFPGFNSRGFLERCHGPEFSILHANKQHHNKAGDRIGAGIGVPLGVALVAAVIYVLYLRNKQRKKRAEEVAAPGEGSAEEGVPGVDERQTLDGNASNGYYGGYEMDGEGRR